MVGLIKWVLKEKKSNFFANWFLYVCSQRVLNRPSCRKLILPLMLKICQRTLTIKSFRDLFSFSKTSISNTPVSYTHLRAHETRHDLVCRLLLEKKKTK